MPLPLPVYPLPFAYYTFHWKSDLSDERKREIAKFFESLTPAQQRLIDDWTADQRRNAAWETYSEA